MSKRLGYVIENNKQTLDATTKKNQTLSPDIFTDIFFLVSAKECSVPTAPVKPGHRFDSLHSPGLYPADLDPIHGRRHPVELPEKCDSSYQSSLSSLSLQDDEGRKRGTNT